MVHTWQLSVEERGLVIQHPAPPIRLDRWRGILSYRLGLDDRRIEPDFRGATFPVPDAAAVAAAGPDLSLEVTFHVQDGLLIRPSLSNLSSQPIALGRLTLSLQEVSLGARPGRLSFFRHGYQSWTETRAFGPRERQVNSWLSPMTRMQDNLRNLADGRRGRFTSDMFAVLGDLDNRVFLLAGQADQFCQFVYVRARLPQNTQTPVQMELVIDLGGKALPPGGRLELDPLVLLAGDRPEMLLDRYFDQRRVPGVEAQDLPVGWCSWYYYYGRISEQALEENLAAAAAREPDWRYFVLDDGYMKAVGDWLSVNRRFPGGLPQVADRIRARGMVPGLWLAPFVAARRSRLYQEHPDWFLRRPNGRPVSAGWNPNWGLLGFYYALDTTHPEVQHYLNAVVHTLVHQYGFGFLKLDFTYAAALPGHAFDPALSPAERVALGHRIIREAAGKDVFILGSGSPLAPVRGLVDAMRIGPDVAPYWFDPVRVRLTRDPHALCTRFAIRSILSRCQMHRRLWINDPDCLILRETETHLTPDERRSLANAVIITGGMVLVSDRLARLAPEMWGYLERIAALARECDRGRRIPLDLMEREAPELIYNSSGFLAVFNLGERPVRKQVFLPQYLPGRVSPDAVFRDVWSGECVPASNQVLDLGELRPHSSRLLKILTP